MLYCINRETCQLEPKKHKSNVRNIPTYTLIEGLEICIRLLEEKENKIKELKQNYIKQLEECKNPKLK